LLKAGATLEGLASWGSSELLSAVFSILAGTADESSRKASALALLRAVLDECSKPAYLCGDLEEPASTLSALLRSSDASLGDLEMAMGHVERCLADVAPEPGTLSAWLRTPQGRKCVQRAEASVSSRQGESEAQVVVELARSRVASLRKHSEWCEAAGEALLELQNFAAEATATGPANRTVFTAAQRDEVARVHQEGWSVAHHLLHTSFSQRWRSSVAAALRAAEQGGVVEHGPVPGLLNTQDLAGALSDAADKHPVLQSKGVETATAGLGGSVHGLLLQHRGDVQLWLGLVDYYFSITVPRPLFLDPVPLQLLADFQGSRLERWSVGQAEAQKCEESFLAVVRRELQEETRRQTDSSFARLRGVIAACVRGEVGGLDEPSMQALLKPLPAESPVTALTRDFLEAGLSP
jgi:hypothetical protein